MPLGRLQLPLALLLCRLFQAQETHLALGLVVSLVLLLGRCIAPQRMMRQLARSLRRILPLFFANQF
jgi:hypothetical protein